MATALLECVLVVSLCSLGLAARGRVEIESPTSQVLTSQLPGVESSIFQLPEEESAIFNEFPSVVDPAAESGKLAYPYLSVS